MSDFITLQQASELSGKSLITIRRLVKELIDNNEPDIKKVLKGVSLQRITMSHITLVKPF